MVVSSVFEKTAVEYLLTFVYIIISYPEKTSIESFSGID